MSSPAIMDHQSAEFPRGIEIERLAEHILDIRPRKSDVLQNVVVKVLQNRELPSCPPVAESSPKDGKGLAAFQRFPLIEDEFAHFPCLSCGVSDFVWKR